MHVPASNQQGVLGHHSLYVDLWLPFQQGVVSVTFLIATAKYQTKGTEGKSSLFGLGV